MRVGTAPDADGPGADRSAPRPTWFLLHALGGSARQWDAVVALIGDAAECVALDLPGFGDRAEDPRTGVGQMTDWLADEIRARDPATYLLVGHSMSGKVATLLAARAEAGEQGLSALAGIVLLAPSPLAPEPMEEERRSEMIGWWQEGAAGAGDAATFVDANTARPLAGPVRAMALADVARSGRHAWLDWLQRGSREDWSGRASALATPALIIVGTEDGDLGEANQRRLTLPLFRSGDLATIADGAHLLPLEQPEEVARLLADQWARVRHRALPAAHARLLASDRVSARTRSALIGRLDDPAADAPGCLGEHRLAILRALVARVLPHGGRDLDLARRLDVALARGEGDGWRFADLPPDAEAWRAGLDTLDLLAGGFARAAPDRQERWLERMAVGEAGSSGQEVALSPAQMRRWFEDVRAETVRAWLAHPATLARIGYDGFANGGDRPRFTGYGRTAAGDREPWQPDAAGAGA